ncbi:MAG: protein TolQ [Syntrophorhabdaceae bacterium]|nr:protein TolQ [Syntrophorhabdaceae bacterium]
MLAGPIVKLILLILIVFSVVSWAVIFMKIKMFSGINRIHDDFARAFAEGKGLPALYERAQKGSRAPMTEVFRAGYIELTRINRERGEMPPPGSRFPTENVTRAMNKAAYEQIGTLEEFLPFLATTGSAAPFIGLFGTVWGIMNAFSGIASSGSATLATVAPGIAEALVATAIGLMAAIPAVIAYNYFLNRIRVIHTRVDGFTVEFINFLDRKIDKG